MPLPKKLFLLLVAPMVIGGVVGYNYLRFGPAEFPVVDVIPDVLEQNFKPTRRESVR